MNGLRFIIDVWRSGLLICPGHKVKGFRWARWARWSRDWASVGKRSVAHISNPNRGLGKVLHNRLRTCSCHQCKYHAAHLSAPSMAASTSTFSTASSAKPTSSSSRMVTSMASHDWSSACVPGTVSNRLFHWAKNYVSNSKVVQKLKKLLFINSKMLQLLLQWFIWGFPFTNVWIKPYIFYIIRLSLICFTSYNLYLWKFRYVFLYLQSM